MPSYNTHPDLAQEKKLSEDEIFIERCPHDAENSEWKMYHDNNPRFIPSGHVIGFDCGIAKNIGLHPAIIYNYIIYWLKFNINNPEAQINGKTWMYSKMEDMVDFFGFLTLDEIKKAIPKLLESGLIIKGKYNKNKFNHTSWYTVYDQEIIKNGKKSYKKDYDSANRHERESNAALSEGANRHDLYKEDKEKEKEEEDKSSSSKPSSSNDDDDSKNSFSNENARPTSDIVVKGTHGKDIRVTETQVFQYFIKNKLDYSTDIILAAIAKIRTIETPINDPLKYLAITADSICKSNSKPAKIPSKKVSESSIPKSDAPGVKWGDIR